MTHQAYRFAANKTAWSIRPAIVALRRSSIRLARTRARLHLDLSPSRQWPARPQDVESLAMRDRWAAQYAGDGFAPDELAAATTCAQAAREISSIRSHRAAIMASIDTAHPSDKARRTLAWLARQIRHLEAAKQRALDDLAQIVGDD